MHAIALACGHLAGTGSLSEIFFFAPSISVDGVPIDVADITVGPVITHVFGQPCSTISCPEGCGPQRWIE